MKETGTRGTNSLRESGSPGQGWRVKASMGLRNVRAAGTRLVQIPRERESFTQNNTAVEQHGYKEKKTPSLGDNLRGAQEALSKYLITSFWTECRG